MANIIQQITDSKNAILTALSEQNLPEQLNMDSKLFTGLGATVNVSNQNMYYQVRARNAGKFTRVRITDREGGVLAEEFTEFGSMALILSIAMRVSNSFTPTLGYNKDVIQEYDSLFNGTYSLTPVSSWGSFSMCHISLNLEVKKIIGSDEEIKLGELYFGTNMAYQSSDGYLVIATTARTTKIN